MAHVMNDVDHQNANSSVDLDQTAELNQKVDLLEWENGDIKEIGTYWETDERDWGKKMKDYQTPTG